MNNIIIIAPFMRLLLVSILPAHIFRGVIYDSPMRHAIRESNTITTASNTNNTINRILVYNC